MTFDPYLAAPLNIQIHAVLAFTALLLGPVSLWRKRRDRAHRIMGYVWVVAMGGAAISALFIRSHFTPIGIGPIHLLSFFALWGIFEAMRAIYRRDIATHRQVMMNLYVRGVCLAGAFNLLPGRTSQRSLIPDQDWIGFVVIGLVLIWAFTPLFAQLWPRLRGGAKNTLAVQTQGR